MSKEKITKVNYFTEEKIAQFLNEDNWAKYQKYLKSCVMKNKDVKDTTYKRYEQLMRQFLTWLGEEYGDIGVYSDEFMEDAVDIMESYMAFCQDVLLNKKKIINLKLSAVSSFYIWSLKRNYIKYHPFDGKIDRMKKANEEHIINHYFLTNEQLEQIRKELYREDSKWTIQDQLFFEIAVFSGNRIGALTRLSLSSLNLDDMVFENIREKEGYRVEISIDDTCKTLIEQWLEMRKDDYDKLECDALFIHKFKGEWKPWSRAMMTERTKQMGEIVGIKDFHPHCWRKTCLNNIYQETGDLNLASQWANHKGSDVTKLYIKEATKSELKEKIAKLRNKNSVE